MVTFMAKQTKNIITRKTIEEYLIAENIKNRKHSALIFCLVALTGIVFAALLSFAFVSDSILGTCLLVVFALVATVPAWFLLPPFIKDLKEYQHLKNGDVEIVTLPLLYETEETRYTRKTRIEYTQHKFHFEGFDACLASSEQSEKFARGDEFYIVYYKGTKEVRLRYPLAFYEYKE